MIGNDPCTDLKWKEVDCWEFVSNNEMKIILVKEISGTENGKGIAVPMQHILEGDRGPEYICDEGGGSIVP